MGCIKNQICHLSLWRSSLQSQEHFNFLVKSFWGSYVDETSKYLWMSFQCNSSRMSQNILCFYLMSFYFRFFDSLRPTKCNKVGVNLFCNSVPHNAVCKMGNFSYLSQIWSQNWTPPSKIVYPFLVLLQKATAAAKSLSWILKLLKLPPCRHSKDNGTIHSSSQAR